MKQITSAAYREMRYASPRCFTDTSVLPIYRLSSTLRMIIEYCPGLSIGPQFPWADNTAALFQV
ncbi:hypothetical protein PLICRDRAFT_38063, partial [Plicaturopsis crispa FD-325 SS-3]